MHNLEAPTSQLCPLDYTAARLLYCPAVVCCKGVVARPIVVSQHVIQGKPGAGARFPVWLHQWRSQLSMKSACRPETLVYSILLFPTPVHFLPPPRPSSPNPALFPSNPTAVASPCNPLATLTSPFLLHAPAHPPTDLRLAPITCSPFFPAVPPAPLHPPLELTVDLC